VRAAFLLRKSLKFSSQVVAEYVIKLNDDNLVCSYTDDSGSNIRIITMNGERELGHVVFSPVESTYLSEFFNADLLDEGKCVFSCWSKAVAGGAISRPRSIIVRDIRLDGFVMTSVGAAVPATVAIAGIFLDSSAYVAHNNYYVQPDGSLSTVVTRKKAGRAYSADYLFIEK
jgi:hypothetical protein